MALPVGIVPVSILGGVSSGFLPLSSACQCCIQLVLLGPQAFVLESC